MIEPMIFHKAVFQFMAMVASIYMTVVIALERYIAVSRPISAYVGGRDNEETMAAWLKVLKYVGPVILLSVVINISTFFEFFIKWDTVPLSGRSILTSSTRQVFYDLPLTSMWEFCKM